MLMENAEKIIARDDIIARLWESDEFIDDNTFMVNVARLRKKLENAGMEKQTGRGCMILFLFCRKNLIA